MRNLRLAAFGAVCRSACCLRRLEGPAEGVYVRVGSTNRRADRDLVEELRRFAQSEAFDEQPMPGVDPEALDFRAASESFAPVRRLTRRDLGTLRLVTDHPGGPSC